ncbi:MAG: translation initiation factor IF-2 N-terminal domain-containing protein, partial [Clostridium sp.]
MRVNELSKELGKTNKEVLEILQKNHFEVTSHASKITEEQTNAVKRALSAGQTAHKAEMPRAEISKSGTGKAETVSVEEIKREPVKAEADKVTETPKKRIAAVYRPQNSTQAKGGYSNQGQKPAAPAHNTAAKPTAPVSAATTAP